jgi:hypothetical protein
MQTLAKWLFGISGMDAAADLRGDVTDFAPGSRNLIPDGVKMSRQFRGLLSAGAGGRKMVQIKDTWGSLDDIGPTHGAGSLFSTVADMLVMIGQGQVRLEGTAVTGAIASSLLKFVLKWNGSYTDPNSGPYTAGLPEPSRPAVGIIDGDLFGAPNLTGTVSIKYARYRKTTGGRSRASETSDVLIVTARPYTRSRRRSSPDRRITYFLAPTRNSAASVCITASRKLTPSQTTSTARKTSSVNARLPV